MSKPRKKRKPPKRVLALPDLEQAKSAVLNTLTSRSSQRTYDHAISEFRRMVLLGNPGLAFNRTVVLRYRIHLEERQYAPATINLRLAAVRRAISFFRPCLSALVILSAMALLKSDSKRASFLPVSDKERIFSLTTLYLSVVVFAETHPDVYPGPVLSAATRRIEHCAGHHGCCGDGLGLSPWFSA